MSFPKQIKDIVYQLLQEPTLDHFREFIRGQTGEHNSIDFKEQWLEKGKLAKIILAIANSGGGIVVFGVHENEDHSFTCYGLDEFRDKAVISNELKKYISPEIKYEVYDFSYSSSEYSELEGKRFQILVVDDTPQFIPFVSQKEGEDIKENTIYVRRGTMCEAANGVEIQAIVSRRVNYEFPHNGQPLELGEHLEQLEELYRHIDEIKREYSFAGLKAFSESLSNSLGGRFKDNPNPFYPEESYDEYVARIIQEKKKKIERILELK